MMRNVVMVASLMVAGLASASDHGGGHHGPAAPAPAFPFGVLGGGAALRVGHRPPSPRRSAGWRGVAPAPPLGTALGNRQEPPLGSCLL